MRKAVWYLFIAVGFMTFGFFVGSGKLSYEKQNILELDEAIMQSYEYWHTQFLTCRQGLLHCEDEVRWRRGDDR